MSCVPIQESMAAPVVNGVGSVTITIRAKLLPVLLVIAAVAPSEGTMKDGTHM
jgi:hypothetical protein